MHTKFTPAYTHMHVHMQVLKRFIMHSKKTAFVVEHDFIMATYLADKVIVYEGQASVHATARAPQGLQTGGCLAMLVLCGWWCSIVARKQVAVLQCWCHVGGACHKQVAILQC
jgi:energy-coupling factor transporter ATP-binding protein EcfA2